MKVLWFTNTPCGATEYLTGLKIIGGGWLYALSEALCSYSDIELHIAFYWNKTMPAFTHNGITYHPIRRDGMGSRLGRYLSRLKRQFTSAMDIAEMNRLQKIVEDVSPDIIHIHGSEDNFGLISEFVDNKNILLSIQGLLSPYYYKLYSGYQRIKVFRHESFISKIICDGYAANERWFQNAALREQRILSHINNIIGRTNWDRDCSLLLNPKRDYYVCNEILRKPFFSANWVKPSTKNKFVLVTTISSGLYKGLEMIFKTAKLLTIHNFDFVWKVVGISQNDSLARMTNKITGIDHKKVNIEFLGRKGAEEIINTLLNSNVFIQVSHIENSPNSLCEAMLLGMPIIASFAGGTDSMLEDGKEGILVQDGDPYRLAGSIMHMKQSYIEAMLMGRAAKARAEVRHNPKNVVDELLTIYERIC